MPPFTSTSWTTFVRRAAQTARQQIVQKASKRVLRFSKQQHRFINLARNHLHDTFPSLSQPTFQRLQPRLQPLPIPIHPLQAAGRNIRMNRFRHNANMRGAADVAAGVGLNPSRGFATSTQLGGKQSAHMLLRSFAGVDREDKSKIYPKGSFYLSYHPYRRRQRRVRRTFSSFPRPARDVDITKIWSIRETDFWFTPPEIDEYFPIATSKPVVAGPSSLVPEQLITENVQTTLSIALTPSIAPFLVNDMDDNLKPSEVGVSVFADLLRGIPGLMQAHNTHASLHVMPLLYRLESLGLFEMTGPTAVGLTLVNHSDGISSAYHLRFSHRSVNDVRTLIGEVSGEGEWYALEEEPLRQSQTGDIEEHAPVSAPSSRHSSGRSSPAESNPWNSSPSNSMILNSIPDVEDDPASSGFVTPIDDSESSFEQYSAFDIGHSSSDLIIPRMDVSQSSIEYTLTPQARSYHSLLSADSIDERSWSGGTNSTGSTGSMGSMASSVSEWSESLDDVEQDLDNWSDGDSNDGSSSPPSPAQEVERRGFPMPGTGNDSWYGVMLPF